MTETLPVGGESCKTVSATTQAGAGEGGSGLRSPRGATFVGKRSKPLRDQRGWIDEGRRREGLEPVRRRWERRATELNAALQLEPLQPALRSRRAYAVARVARLTADIAPRLDACGVEGLPIACACGPVGAKKTCRQWWLCGECRARRGVTLQQDIRRGLAAALEREVMTWGDNGGRGMRPQLILLTLTQRHSGDIIADQEALAVGWRKLYVRMHEDYGAFPFVGVWEVTRGRDGLGHVHMHVAAVWRYRDWSRIREQWVVGCPTSAYLDIKQRRKDGKDSSPSSVSKYLGKYISKGVDVSAFSPEMRADVSAAFYNKRSVLTSHNFWRREPKCCRTCLERYRMVEVEHPSILESMRPGVLSLYFHGLSPP